MSADTITMTHHESSRGGEYRAHTEGGTHAGELTWRDGGQDVRIADHTGVPTDMQGKGIAGMLVDALIADAREHGFKIVPACSYVAAQFKRHPDWADLRAD